MGTMITVFGSGTGKGDDMATILAEETLLTGLMLIKIFFSI